VVRQPVTGGGLLVLAIFGSAAVFTANARVSVAAERPDIVLIMTDQQFADAMSCRMGDQYIQTPTMDGLAKTGTLFTRAYTPNPLCMPARNSIFTGRYPHQTGIAKNAKPVQVLFVRVRKSAGRVV